MHTYGEWPDELFNEVEQTASEIGKYCTKWGRISVHQTKEKYGTVRVYCHFGWDCFHSIIWPRHMWIHKWWPYRLDLALSRHIMTVLNKIVIPYQIWIYQKAYGNAVKKRFYLRDEILCCADFEEALEGVEGYKHSDYWKEYK